MFNPRRLFRFLTTVILLLAGLAMAADNSDGLRLQKVSEQIYAIVGPFGNRSPENLGNDATFGFVVTDDGVVLVDPGGSYQGAAATEALIRQVTDWPVKVVINSKGQNHRWLGNGYFKERGARLIASAAAVEDQRARHEEQMLVLGNLVGAEGMAGTDPVYADETFEEEMNFTFGGTRFSLHRVDLPLLLQPVAYVLPLTYGPDVLHGAMHGRNALPVALDLLALCTYCVGLFVLSLFNIRRRWIR